MRLAIRSVLVVSAATLVLSGCVQTGSESETVEPSQQQLYPELATYPDIEVIPDLDFGSTHEGITLDVCLPEPDDTQATTGDDGEIYTGDDPDTARAAMVSVHGGSWRQGDKANVNWRSVCQWLADEGFVTFSLNYALAPDNPFPAAFDDLQTAVEWMREPAQQRRFDLDPERVGAFGGSAGGNLVSLLGVDGTGDLTNGSRIAAVAELSGPADLTTAGFALGEMEPAFRDVQLAYLGCASYANCPAARPASPLYAVDPSDPPFFVGHSIDERIPLEQSDAFVEALRDDGISVDYVTVEGTAHSIAMLDERMRERIGAWLRDQLG